MQLKTDANMEIFGTKNITKINKYKTSEQYFYDVTQNRHEHYQNQQIRKTEHHFYDGLQNRTQLHFREPSNKHKQIQQTSKLPTKKINENIQSTTDKYTLSIPVTKKSEERKTVQ